MNENSYKNWSEMSDQALLETMGKFFKQHRIKQQKTQDEVSAAAGLSRSTVSLIERGGSVALSSVIRVMRVLDLLYIMENFNIDDGPSPIEYARLQSKKRKRVRK